MDEPVQTEATDFVVGPIQIEISPNIEGEIVVRFETWGGVTSPERGEK